MNQASPFIRLSLLDASESAAGVNAWMRSGTTVAQGESAATTLTSVVGALSDAVVTSRYIVYRGSEVPRPEAPGGAPVGGAGVFVFACVEPDQYAIVVIPAIRLDLLVIDGPGNGVLIKQDDPAVIAFRDAMITGIWSNPFGVQLASLESAFYQWRT